MNLTDFSGQRPEGHPNISLQFRVDTRLLHTLSRLELLGLAGTANTTSESSEGDNLLVLLDITKVSVGLGQLETYQQSGTSSL